MSEILETVFNDDNVPSHAIVSFIWNCDAAILEKISPRTLAYRKYIKVPLLLMVGLTGTLSGLAMSLGKCSTELIATEGGLSVPASALGLTGLVVGGFEMFTLNLAMQYYN